MVVCTFNVRLGVVDDGRHRWANRRSLVLDCLREINADIVCTQEAYDFQWTEIHAALLGYGCYAVGRDDGVTGGESCAIFYRSTLGDPLQKGTFWLSDRPEIPGSRSHGSACTRICSYLRFPEFTIANTHWDHISDEARAFGAQLIVDALGADKNLILCGDFNAELDSPELSVLTSTLTPTIEARTTTYHNFGKEPNGPHIDHILISPGLTAIKANVLRRESTDVWPSDHFPVVATIASSDS